MTANPSNGGRSIVREMGKTHLVFQWRIQDLVEGGAGIVINKVTPLFEAQIAERGVSQSGGKKWKSENV